MAEKELQKAQAPTMAQYIEGLSTGILADLNTKQAQGLVLPKNYAARNALLAAIFKIKETKDKDGNLALAVCSEDSVKQAVMEMLTKGLDPNKTQCYFIVYGNKLTMFPSYFGLIHLAKEADPNIADVFSEVVYDGDTFRYQIRNGYKIVSEHSQDIDNINLDKIKGAYATIVYHNGTERSEYMSMQQIRNSWVRGATKGNSDAHKLAPEEMCKRTVLKRLLKNTVNTSNDEQLLNSLSEIDDEAERNEATVPIDITPTEEQYEMPKQAKAIEPEAKKPEPAPEPPKAKPEPKKKEPKPEPEPQEQEVQGTPDWAQVELPDILSGE